jgi:hypothetical protein
MSVSIALRRKRRIEGHERSDPRLNPRVKKPAHLPMNVESVTLLIVSKENIERVRYPFPDFHSYPCGTGRSRVRKDKATQLVSEVDNSPPMT